ncbi:MAG: hypothetical protein CM15mV6_2570 [uncultured marine virus]|nr:MAG: hypothetical protein CM15mV6_2570 [uncultured marine virus]
MTILLPRLLHLVLLNFMMQTSMLLTHLIRYISVYSTARLLVILTENLPLLSYRYSTSIITTADGYRWKYLYTIPVGQVLKFFSNEYMPVLEDTAVISDAVGGEIDTVIIGSSVLVTTTAPTKTSLLKETVLVDVYH